MYISANDRKKLTSLAKSKAYRDAYVGEHVRAFIAYQIQAIRDRMGLSQAAFADRVGMKQSVISRIENPNYGKVTVQTLLHIALALDVGLLIRFCAYPDFLPMTADVSPKALAVENVHESVQNAESQLQAFVPTPDKLVGSRTTFWTPAEPAATISPLDRFKITNMNTTMPGSFQKIEAAEVV
jgi:transcriptional regulator with XRE-family HTH domain